MMSSNENIVAGPGFKAQLKFYDCKSSYECITANSENAHEMVKFDGQ